ncbi:hypothetical protein GXM_02657 [Nostoc sphaeroides CCNUC1]|uniref:Uncharacterized protein n=1 Tax=Nostoc sphaeroides CCNUC1 TaxID=2653204 RepID=A0A5P8VXR5_9NOSO|nr:hypothetical protein GXM_02657 [Nostoc sphaeroides CCNUC1]
MGGKKLIISHWSFVIGHWLFLPYPFIYIGYEENKKQAS